MSLADELIADLEEGGEEEIEQVEDDQADIVGDIEDVGGAMDTDDIAGADSVKSVAKLRDSTQVC